MNMKDGAFKELSKRRPSQEEMMIATLVGDALRNGVEDAEIEKMLKVRREHKHGGKAF